MQETWFSDKKEGRPQGRPAQEAVLMVVVPTKAFSAHGFHMLQIGLVRLLNQLLQHWLIDEFTQFLIVDLLVKVKLLRD